MKNAFCNKLFFIASAFVLSVSGPGISASIPAFMHGLVVRPAAPAVADGSATNCESSSRVYLRRAVGELPIRGRASTDTYEAYFLIPVPFGDQAPIFLTIESPELIEYRFLRLTPPNVIVVAKMKKAPSTTIHWEAWVLIRENKYEGLPASVPMPTVGQLPEEVWQWLQPTDCVQSNDPFIMEKAAEARGQTTDLMVLSDSIADVCYNIPWEFPHDPIAFDAHYALKWGNSCTGHAHAGAALFRANGVPARSLMVMPSWYDGYFDMHWIADYYVPDYGWVRMETSGGMNKYPPQDEIVTMACNPGEEFPLFYPQGIEGYWHTSDPILGVGNPNWGGAHAAFDEGSFSADPADVAEAINLTGEVFSANVDTWGVNLTEGQKAKVQEAYQYQTDSLQRLQVSDITSYLAAMRNAKASYSQVDLNPLTEIFSDDFEGTDKGWTHGGTGDTWMKGTPSGKPSEAHSGTSCWGTGFSGAYANSANCWLLSPEFDLSNRSCAYFDFWLYNWVQDGGQTVINDPLWMELTTDGATFLPLCSEMGGVNEDPEIPPVGGWSHMVLDLTKYAGTPKVRVRFHFKSDSSVTAPGSFIDDIRVYGRDSGSGSSLACSVSTELSSGPFPPLVVKFSSSVTGGVPPYEYSWVFGDGGTSSEANPSHIYENYGSYDWTLTVTSGDASCSTNGTVAIVVAQPAITEIKKAGDPFRLIVTGRNFPSGCKVLINGTPVPATDWKDTTKVIAKKGSALKALCPKGVVVKVAVQNPDGVVSDEFSFTR